MKPDFDLYLVTDRGQIGGRDLIAVVEEALAAGVRAVQLRERDLSARELLPLARELRRVTAAAGARLLINEHIDVAVAADADGVQLRADHVPISVARRLLGPDALIGVSTHSLAEVQAAQAADFALFGPVFATPSKQEYGAPLGLEALRAAATVSRIPIFAIGGVTAERVSALRASGAAGVAVIGAILKAPQARDAAALMLAALRRTPALARS